ncbi:MAG TPA: type II secretion system F family protein [Sedimentisphaerales bacterium]|nr:type II secretion system F family protein [Sedimentisphaerales bacterium]
MDDEALLLVAGLAVVVAAIAISAVVSRWFRKLAMWILILIAICLAIAAAMAVLGPWSFLIFILAFFLIALLISYGLTSRHTTAVHVISTIGASIRQNLPLPMALESAAGGRTDKRARILRSIERWLVQGYSLSESIRRGYPKCPGHAAAMIAVAERIDQLPYAIKAIEANMMARAEERRRIKPVSPFYPLVLLTIMFLIVLGLSIRVIPKLHAVFEEMFEGQALPAATRFLFGVTGFIAYRSPLPWLVPLILILVAVVAIHVRLRPRRPQKPHLLSRVGDFIKWRLPILHWFERNHSLVQAVEVLRLSLNAGCTVNDAIANTLDLDVNNCFRSRLRDWLDRVEAGRDISASATESGLGSSLAWAFDQNVNQGNTLSVLETLESFYRSNYSYRINLVRFILEPLVTISMGLMVGFVMYAVFSPLVAAIDHLAIFITP